ncbi:MAG: ABC transporter permease [Gammaproteobacteria bacterium]|nr:ABC transporter permease [Gammaproteobacteria bacterium]
MQHFFHALFEGSRAALQSIRAHALRSSLTTLGIIIGVASVITVVAVMNGLSASIRGSLDDLGSDMIIIRAYTTPEQELLGFRNKLRDEDYLLLKSKVKNIEDITATMPAFSLGLSVGYGRNSTQTQLIGADSSYQNVVRVYPQQGRFLSSEDDNKRRRVAFIGATVAKKLQMPANPIGQYINLSGDWFRVIGMAEKRGSLFGFDQDNYIITPFSTAKALNGPDNLMVEISYRPKADADPKLIEQQIRQLLRHRAKLAPDAPDHFEFVSAEKTKQQLDTVFNSITAVAAGVVSISLLVGGIGVMNIMLVSVTERTREIGIVKALGATPQFILLQFLVEALVLSLFGGVLGLVLGYLFAALIAFSLPSMPGALVPLWAIGLSFGFTSLIGLVFGLAPAVKAARLQPIDALRYE